LRSSKDLAKRLRFEPRPRPYLFRRVYLVVGALACVAAAGLWLLFGALMGERQYLPGPVSPAHATFGDRCESCHTAAFTAISDDACRACHATAPHSEHETSTSACRQCHVEHRGRVALTGISDQPCIGCHANLETRRSTSVIAAQVASFDAHPVFAPLREGRADPASLRFNHRLHLESPRIPADRKLDCPACHTAEADGALMRPIVFETHCHGCHRQGGLGPLGDIEAPHEAPEVVRFELGQQLLAQAVADPGRIFGEPDFFLPGRGRDPIDQSSSLVEYQGKWLGDMEDRLYAEFDGTTPLEQSNKHCFLCHLRGEAAGGDGLPAIRATEIPRRWLRRARFSHRAHEVLDCEVCHAGVRGSEMTSQVNLPDNVLCQRCHDDGARQSAGTDCVGCHVYHLPGVEPGSAAVPRPRQSMEALTGLQPPRPFVRAE
jgi:hypothetical protein